MSFHFLFIPFRTLPAGAVVAACVAFVLSAVPAYAGGGSEIVLDGNAPSHVLGLNMDYLEDPGRVLTISDVTQPAIAKTFAHYNKAFPSFGFTDSAFWFRTRLVNSTSRKQDLILEELIPYIDSIELYTPDPTAPNGYRVRHVGDKVPFRQREIQHHSFLFPLSLDPNRATPIYIRVESRAALMTPFTLWQKDAFHKHSANASFAFGLFFGILAVIALYAFYLYLRMKDRNYLYFILFVFSIALMVATSHGLSYMHLWPESTFLAERMQVVCISLIQLFGVLFARNFLTTHLALPLIDRFLKLLIGVHLFIILSSFLTSDIVPLAKMTIFAVQFYAPVLILSGFLSWRRGNKAARFYLLAWTSSLIGSLVTSFTLLNIFPYHFILLNAVSIGFLLDASLLSLALVDRLYVLRQERDHAKQQAHEALQLTKDRLEDEVAKRTAELETAKMDADLANQAKTQFLSHMSHELRTPLNGILGFAELLLTDREAPLTPGQQRSATIIHDSGKHLNALIDDILNISMIETGKLTTNMDSVSFRDVLDNALVVIAAMARKRRIQIFNASDRDDLFWVTADQLRLRQVIINLISNAVKYSPEGGLVTISLDKQDGIVRFSVRDTGPGISADNLSLIFEPFTRLQNGRSEVDGVGIGLTITKKLIELMNGRIVVDSTVGRGSTFSVELAEAVPSRRPHDAAGQEMPDRVPHLAPNAAGASGLLPLVLYVEDNRANQVYVEHIFQRRPDLRLICSATGQEGIALALEHRPDIILTDVLLPDISGHDVLKELKAHHLTKDTPVIAVSANATEADLLNSNNDGFVSYLTKPLGIDELLDTIDTLLACRVA